VQSVACGEPIIIKSYHGNDAVIFGYASVFNVLDYDNDIILKGAFLPKAEAKKVRFLWQHNYLKPIGVVRFLNEDDYGLQVEAVINSKVVQGFEAIELIKQGAVSGLSIGFTIKSANYNNLGHRLIESVELLEISIVTFPANHHAEISVVNSRINNFREQMMIEETNPIEDRVSIVEKRIDDIEKYFERPKISYLHDEQYSQFDNYLRKGIEANLITKTLSSTEEFGGVLVTPTIYDKIIRAVSARSPMRQLASIQTISSNVLDVVVEDGKFSCGWVEESETRKETETPKLLQRKIHIHELYAQPKATQRLIDDSVIQIESWLIESLVDSFVRAENEAFINGDGQKKPQGILSVSKNQEVIFKAGKDITTDMLLKMISSLAEEYLSGCAFLMNRATLAIIQNLKDNNGRFIWQPSLSESLKQTIFGIPVVCSSNMPVLGTNAMSIILGDFKAAYKIVDRVGVSVMRDPYTDKSFIKFYAVKRVGAAVVNPSAMKIALFN